MIHFTGEPGSKSNAKVKKESLEAFLCVASVLEIVLYSENERSPCEEIIAR